MHRSVVKYMLLNKFLNNELFKTLLEAVKNKIRCTCTLWLGTSQNTCTDQITFLNKIQISVL